MLPRQRESDASAERRLRRALKWSVIALIAYGGYRVAVILMVADAEWGSGYFTLENFPPLWQTGFQIATAIIALGLAGALFIVPMTGWMIVRRLAHHSPSCLQTRVGIIMVLLPVLWVISLGNGVLSGASRLVDFVSELLYDDTYFRSGYWNEGRSAFMFSLVYALCIFPLVQLARVISPTTRSRVSLSLLCLCWLCHLLLPSFAFFALKVSTLVDGEYVRGQSGLLFDIAFGYQFIEIIVHGILLVWTAIHLHLLRAPLIEIAAGNTCPSCGFDLSGNIGSKPGCPECGWRRD